MKSVGVAIAVCLVGCTKFRPERQAAGEQGRPRTNSEPRASRFSTQWRGRVDAVNAKGQFVVISFPIGALPAPTTRLSIYRNNAKVGEVKVTPPQQGNLTAADILSGECQVGDEARGQR